MLDVNVLDNSLKLRSLARLFASNHPILRTIREHINLSNFFFPVSKAKFDELSNRGMELLKCTRQLLWLESDMMRDRFYVRKVKEIRLPEIMSDLGRQSLTYFSLLVRQKNKVKDLNEADARSLRRFLKFPCLGNVLQQAVRLTYNIEANNGEMYLTYRSGKWIDLCDLTSKQIREYQSPIDPLCVFKVGLILTPTESINVFAKLNKLTSTRHKDIYLKVLHGDIYTNDRLFRFGLREDPLCPNCGCPDTLEHRLINCPRLVEFTNEVVRLTRRICDVNPDEQDLDQIQIILGAHLNTNPSILTVHAELLREITFKVDDPTPTPLRIRRLLSNLIRNESNNEVRNKIMTLLNS